MKLANQTPPGQSPYIAGPYPGLGTQYGEYVGIATVNLPGDVRHVSSPSNSSVVTNGPEGPTLLVEGRPSTSPPEPTKSITFNFVLPQSQGTLTVVPSRADRASTGPLARRRHDVRGRHASHHLVVTTER